ncbi:hypothetical protein ACET3Z_025658 [Daucus carota]
METAESDSSAAGRKRRVTALDEFLLNRVSKMQHKGYVSSPEPHSAHSDVPSTPRTALAAIDTNTCMNKTVIETTFAGKDVAPDVPSEDSRKRGRGPNVDKVINQMEKENQPAVEKPQGTKHRGRGPEVKTLAKQRLAQETQYTPSHSNVTSNGSATPRSTITQQGTTGASRGSHSAAYNLPTNTDMVRRTFTKSNSSAVLQQLNSDESHRPFRPSTGASTSGVKNFLNEFEDVCDPSDFAEEDFMHGIVFQPCIFFTKVFFD